MDDKPRRPVVTQSDLSTFRGATDHWVNYQKAGVMLSELVPEEGQQTDLLGYSYPAKQSGRLMETVDTINRRYKRSTIHLASESTKRTWSMRRRFKSPNYTGDWTELPVVG